MRRQELVRSSAKSVYPTHFESHIFTSTFTCTDSRAWSRVSRALSQCTCTMLVVRCRSIVQDYIDHALSLFLWSLLFPLLAGEYSLSCVHFLVYSACFSSVKLKIGCFIQSSVINRHAHRLCLKSVMPSSWCLSQMMRRSVHDGKRQRGLCTSAICQQVYALHNRRLCSHSESWRLVVYRRSHVNACRLKGSSPFRVVSVSDVSPSEHWLLERY